MGTEHHGKRTMSTRTPDGSMKRPLGEMRFLTQRRTKLETYEIVGSPRCMPPSAAAASASSNVESLRRSAGGVRGPRFADESDRLPSEEWTA